MSEVEVEYGRRGALEREVARLEARLEGVRAKGRQAARDAERIAAKLEAARVRQARAALKEAEDAAIAELGRDGCRLGEIAEELERRMRLWVASCGVAESEVGYVPLTPGAVWQRMKRQEGEEL